jgi:enoyl-CoA hydratase
MEHLTLEATEPGIALLTLNRPDRLNALSQGLIAELHQVFDQLAADRSTAAVVLTGAGRGFCAGVDLQEMETPEGSKALDGPMRGMATQEHLSTLITHIRRIPQPVIAAVNGAAVGGGMALACACDVRVASTAAKFGTQFIKVGVSGCDVGISYLLPHLVGAGRAFELILTGRLIDGEEAERIGLVSRVVPADDVVEAAMEIARVIAGHSPFGVWMTKEVLWANLDAPNVETAMRLEDRTQILAINTGDFKEAATAFVEKRAPKFGGWDA